MSSSSDPTPDLIELEEPRQRLLEAAGQIFAEKGFTAASVGEITEKAETNRASVNYYFRNKEQLYVEAVRLAAQGCEKRALPLEFVPGSTAEEQLRVFVRSFLSRFFGEEIIPWHGQLIMRELGQQTAGACERFVQEFVRPNFEVLGRILRELTPTTWPPMRLHLIGNSIVGQCLHYFHARHVLLHLVGVEEYAQYDLERVTHHVWEFSVAALRGLVGTSPAPRTDGSASSSPSSSSSSGKSSKSNKHEAKA